MKKFFGKLRYYLSRFEALLLGLLEKFFNGLVKKLTAFSCRISLAIDRIEKACNDFIDNCKVATTA